MKWSFKIARVAGIDVNMHVTFLLLVAFVAVTYWMDGGVMAVAGGVLFLLALFLCVLLHEFGHALTARRFGIQTRDIILLPIGGVARLERMPEKPLQELLVALAGPAVNLVIALLLFAGLVVTHTLQPLTQLSLTDGSFAERMLAVNLALLLFNLVPAFPMDGGRAMRALLATRMEYTRATHIAATLGQGLALAFGLAGLMIGNPSLLFIAFFVWIGAGQESSMVQVKSALSGIPVSRAMLTEFHTLSPTDPLSRAVELIVSSSQHDFPVVADGHVVGILTREGLISALRENKETIFVSYVMQKEFAVIDSNQMLDDVAQQIQTGSQHIIPVMHNDSLVGLFTMENAGEFLMIQNAVRARKQANSALPQ